jgi:thiamine-phosphate pyrophosphorylase
VLRAAGAYGVAVVGALSSAADPQRTTSELLAAVTA